MFHPQSFSDSNFLPIQTQTSQSISQHPNMRSLRCQPFHAVSHPDTTLVLRWALGWVVPGGADTLWAPFGCAGGTTWPPESRRAPGVSGAPATVPNTEVKRWGNKPHPGENRGMIGMIDFLGWVWWVLGEFWWLEMPAPACCFGGVVYHSIFP